MAKNPKERTLLFYDAFRDVIESSRWIVPELRYKAPQLIKTPLSLLGRSQVRVLDQAVTRTLLDLTNKAGMSAVPYVPYPKYPMWVEFEETALGDEAARYVAIWACPDPLEEGVIRFDLISFDLGEPDRRTKSLRLFRNEASWSIDHSRVCTLACPFAEAQTGTAFSMSSHNVKDLVHLECQCAGSDWGWAQLIFMLGHLLRMPRVLHETVVSRDEPLPRNFHQRQQVERENKKYPRYVRLSLSTPRIEVHRKTALAASPQAHRDPTTYLEVQQVAGSWRALIPGEGKPWKELKVFYVDSYQRNQPSAEQSTRYIIEP